MNHVSIIGRLTHDPVVRETKTEKTVCDLRVAVNGPRRGDGTQDATFLSVTAWNGLAATAGEHLVRGRLVAVSGRLALDEWTAEGGERRQRVFVVAEAIDFLDAPRTQADEAA